MVDISVGLPPKLLGDGESVVWRPQSGPQTLFCACGFRECLYGGAAGGGKSDALIGDFSMGIFQYGGAWRGMIARQSFPQLEEIERRCMEIFSPVFGASSYKVGRRTWEFETPRGVATLMLRALEKDEDAHKFQGHQFTYLGFDELTHWPSDYVYEFLVKTRLRSPHGAPCYVRATANPGGPGHTWVKRRFMEDDNGRPVQALTPIHYVGRSGARYTRIFIPARLTDNKILMENDPAYIDQLDAIRDPVMRRALLLGDWDIIRGAAFPEFRREVHVIENKAPDPKAKHWRSMDWGLAKPYSCLWYQQDYDGDVVIWNQLKGCGEKAGEGSRETPEQVMVKIMDLEDNHELNVTEGWLDGACFSADQTENDIAKQLGGLKMGWRAAAKGPGSRVRHKQLVHDMLKVVNGQSRLRIMERCEPLITTLTTIQRSKNNPEDVDTDGDDHDFDSLRYGLAKNSLTAGRFRASRDARAKVARYNEGVVA